MTGREFLWTVISFRETLFEAHLGQRGTRMWAPSPSGRVQGVRTWGCSKRQQQCMRGTASPLAGMPRVRTSRGQPGTCTWTPLVHGFTMRARHSRCHRIDSVRVPPDSELISGDTVRGSPGLKVPRRHRIDRARVPLDRDLISGDTVRGSPGSKGHEDVGSESQRARTRSTYVEL